MTQRRPTDVISGIAVALHDAPSAVSLWLAGSHGAGLADAYSDIDFLLVCEGGPDDAMAAAWRAAVEQVDEIVLYWDREVKPSLINAITADWTRIDVEIVTPAQFAERGRHGLKPVFGGGDTLAGARPSGAPATAKRRIAWRNEEFLRILGLLHLGLGREEYLTAVTGAFFLRSLLIELMVDETAAPHRGGMLHLNRLISAEQRRVLETMPALVPEREALTAAYIAYASAFLPRARAFSARNEIAWPTRFEDATWRHLQRTLGISRPPRIV